MKFIKSLQQNSMLLLALAMVPINALAHHDMDGQAPQNLWQGFLSGLAHPVIGLDHLSFVLLAGLLAFVVIRKPLSIGLFLGASMLGCLLPLAGLDLPQAELGILVSLLIAAGLSWSQRSSTGVVMLLFTFAGLLHGYAYGESVVGSEMAPLGAYLLGLTLVQALLAACFGACVKEAVSRQPRAFLALQSMLSLAVALLVLSHFASY